MILRSNAFAIKPQSGSCDHVYKARYYDICDIPKDKLTCPECTSKRIGKSNRKGYDDIIQFFAKFGCTLVTTEEEYNENNMTKKSTFKIRAKCGHEITKIPGNMSKQKDVIYCSSACKEDAI
jgi:hypothetical protein